MPRPYANPYVAGAGLGLVLLASFALSGRGLGASGAFASILAGSVNAVAPATAASSSYLQQYLDGANPWLDWLVLEVAGLMAGGALSAWWQGRWRVEIERGPRMSVRRRVWFGLIGGAAMGVGAVLARGCTSGQALSGGAMLSVGSWLFLGVAFASAYAMAQLLRKAWT